MVSPGGAGGTRRRIDPGDIDVFSSVHVKVTFREENRPRSAPLSLFGPEDTREPPELGRAASGKAETDTYGSGMTLNVSGRREDTQVLQSVGVNERTLCDQVRGREQGELHT